MIRKSIGLALLVVALLAFVLALAGGVATAGFDPFHALPYYPYGNGVGGPTIGLPVTGLPPIPGGPAGIPAWIVPALAGAGVAAIAGFVALQFRTYRR